MGFLTQKRTIGFKVEGTPYTAETLVAVDYNLAAYDVSYDLDIPMKNRKLTRGYYARDKSVAGKRAFSCSFSIDLYTSVSLGTAPNYGKALRAVGLLETVYAGVGVGYAPVCENSATPATIEIVEKSEGTSPEQRVVKGAGCMGSCKMVVGAVGEPIKLEFEFKGYIVSVTDRNYAGILEPTGVSDVTPDAVLSATISVGGVVQTINSLTMDMGNVVELWTDPSNPTGYSGARVVDREPTMEMDPDMELIATEDDYGLLTNNTTGALVFTVGDITISAPACQYIKAGTPGDREGHVTNTKNFELKRGTTGNDEFEILQGAKV